MLHIVYIQYVSYNEQKNQGEGVYEEVREWSDGEPLFTGEGEPANSCYYEECCTTTGCIPSEVESTEC